jgi:type II secretory pathway component PulK
MGKRTGFALITALAMLVLFTMLGAAFLGYMVNDYTRQTLTSARLQAEVAAESGVHAAVGRLRQAVAAGNAAEVVEAGPMTVTLPLYEHEEDRLEPGDAEASVTVTIADESARLNINHVPTSVLSAALGVSGAKAREIRTTLPRFGSERDGSRHWFASVGELVTRGLLTEEEFTALDTSRLTVFSAMNPAAPSRFLNVNAAPVDILAAVLGVPRAQAESVAAARPFDSLDALSAAAGKPAAAFNLGGDAGLPPALAFGPTSFRIRAEATVPRSGGRPVGRAEVEAVVCIVPGSPPKTTYWSQSASAEPSEATVTAGEEAPDAAPATAG